MKIKKGDNVIVLTGKSRGHKGKVAKVFPARHSGGPAEGRVIVEGANLAKRRQRPRKQGEKGQTLEMAQPMSVSNVAFYCGHCGKGVKVGYQVEAGKKVRICRQCKREI